MAQWLMVSCVAVAIVGCAYALGAAVMVRRFGAANVPTASIFPGVTILKPLRGAESHLYDNLISFCNQNYPGPVQVLFGVQDAADPAIAVVKRVVADCPGRDLELVVHSSARGPNPKVANLIGMQDRIRHELVILADSDISVAPDYLARLVAALDAPGVGLVTCLYRGEHAGRRVVAARRAWRSTIASFPTFWSDCSSAWRDRVSAPRSRLDARRSLRSADSRRSSTASPTTTPWVKRCAPPACEVAIPHFVVVHSSPIASAGEWWRHQVRWARTVRSVSPLGYAGLGVTHPLPFALVAAWLTGFGALGATIIGASIASRLVLQVQVDHTLRVRPNRWWLGPVSDLLSFMVYVAGFFVSIVSWRGIRYKVSADGTLTPLGEPKA